MDALVVYDSQYGDTERIARTIADALNDLGEARVVPVDPAHPVELRGVELLVVGCPTQGWGPTPAMRSFLEEAPSEELRDLAVALFDTRFRMPVWMIGSAAGMMAERLGERGVPPIVARARFRGCPRAGRCNLTTELVNPRRGGTLLRG